MALSRSELEALTAIDIRDLIPEKDLKAALSSPPFIQSSSLFNIRDIGAVSGSPIPEGRIYRCANLGQVSTDPEALAWLASHVRRIFDLRKDRERLVFPTPDITSIENVWMEPPGQHEEPHVGEWAAGDGSRVYGDQYMVIVDAYKPTIRAILEHVRDRPTEPIIFHCSGGRDRTGVVAGLLQNLAGASDNTVVFDYMLSRIGVEPERERLTQFAMMGLGISDIEAPGFLNFASLRPTFWTTFDGQLKEKYGSWDGYVTQCLGFSDEDISVIKSNLRV